MEKIKEFVSDHIADIVVVVACAFFVLGCWLLYTANRTANDNYHVTNTVQSIKDDNHRQENRLEMLQTKLNTLKSNSTEASNELMKSQEELDRLRNELIKTQKSLTIASESLQKASETLQKQEASLQTLTEEIKRMEHKQMVMRRQRDVYALLFALSVGAAISGR